MLHFIIRCSGTLALLAAVSTTGACSRSSAPAKQYPLKGQILAVDIAKRELTINHEDIPGFMPGMVMTYRVSDAKELEGRKRGDLVTATLVVDDLRSEVRNITRIGEKPVAPAAARAATTAIVAAGEPVPDAPLVDTRGDSKRLSDYRGKLVVLTFLYTRCPLPEFCPRTERNLLQVQTALAGDSALRDRVHLIAVSLDPAYDTPEVLRKHAAAVGARPDTWTFLTGDVNAVEDFGAKFGLTIMRNPSEPANIAHNLRTAIIGADGKLLQIIDGADWTPSQVISALREARGQIS
jgi:protein SCO1/2